MERVEYRTDGNRIGLSIKYPDEIPRKWSETDATISCAHCESEHISTDKTGSVLTLTCHNCPNWWSGDINEVLTWHDTEEALVDLFGVPFTE